MWDHLLSQISTEKNIRAANWPKNTQGTEGNFNVNMAENVARKEMI